MGVDTAYNFYFVSDCQTKHVQNVLQNPSVSLAIFDSHATPGSANGVQVSGTCQRLVGKEVQTGIDAIYSRRYPDAKTRAGHNLAVQEFSKPDSEPRARHIYKITPKHIYVLDKTSGEDARVEARIIDI